MRWYELFKVYQRKIMNKSLIFYSIIAVSLMISVAFSIAIPQLVDSTEQYIYDNALAMNGADLKVVAGSYSEEFNHQIEELRNNGKIESGKLYEQCTTTLNYDKNRLFCSVICGEYDISSDEVIIYKDLAETLRLKVNDKISILGKEYRICEIQEDAVGVDKSSEIFGYCKISDRNTEFVSSGYIYLIETQSTEYVKDVLYNLESNYTYTTFEEQKDSMIKDMNTNLMALNMLNTMCILMALISVISAIFMIIKQRSQDIAVLKCLSINKKAIRKAFNFEVRSVLMIPLVLGAALSIPITKLLLRNSGITYTLDWNFIIGGVVFFAIVYCLFVNVITWSISNINPIDYLRGNAGSFSFSTIKVVIKCVVYLLIALFTYAVFYVGKSDMFSSSIAILALVLVFYIITRVIIKLVSVVRPGTGFVNYAIRSMRSNASSNALFVINLVILGWFILFGFAFESISEESYKNNLSGELAYNYMASCSGDDMKNVEASLNVESVTDYMVLERYLGNAVIKDADGTYQTVDATLASVSIDNYTLPYGIIEGKDIIDCESNEVLVSKKFAATNNVSISDEIGFSFAGDSEQSKVYYVGGIYEAGNVNDAFIIVREEVSDGEYHLPLVLIKADSDDFMEALTNTSIVNVDFAGKMLANLIGDYLIYFKYMCVICVISTLFLIINMTFIKYNNNKEIVIVDALGIPKTFQYKSLIFRNVLLLIVAFGITILFFGVTMKLVMRLFLDVEAVSVLGDTVVPLILVGIIGCSQTVIEFLFVKYKSKEYDLLREKV